MEKCQYGCKNGRIFMEATGVFVPCPSCGATPLNKLKEQASGILQERYNESGIPPIYQRVGLEDFTKLFNHPTLINNFEADSIATTKEFLKSLILDLSNGELPKSSLYIHLPYFLESEQYVYLLQRIALDNRLTCTPYISLNALNGLTRSSDYGLTSLKGVTLDEYSNPEILDCIDGCKLANEYKMTYSDFIQCDLCILNASANTSQRGFNALADILAERSKRGKSTIVIGYWGSKNKNAKALNYLKDDEYTINKQKVLKIIEMTKKSSESADGSIKTKGVTNSTPQLRNFTI